VTHIEKRRQPQILMPYGKRQPDMPGFDLTEETLDARRILGKLFKRKYQILAVVLIVLIPAAVATYLATPLFRSSALLQVNPDPVQVLPYREVGDFTSASPYYEVYMKTQEQVLNGPTLVARVAERLNSDSNLAEMRSEVPLLRKRFAVQRIENSQLFRLSYTAPAPEVAAGMVNIFAEEYLKELFRVRQATREKARTLLEGELAGLEQRVQASEKDLARYARDNNMVSTEPGQIDLVEQRLVQMATRITDVDAEIVVARSRVESMKKASIQNFPEKLLTPSITALASKILELEHDLSALRINFGENWPAVVQKREEMAVARDQLTREKASAIAQSLEQAQMDLEAAESRHRMMTAAMGQQQELVNQYRNASIQYSILRREVETNQKLYEGLLERLRQTSVTAGLEFGNIQVVEPGRPDNQVDSPKVVWNLGLASLLGLALGVCFAFVKDFWDNSISTLEEAEQLASLPALGSVPLVAAVKCRVLISQGSGRSSGAGTVLSLQPSQSVAVAQHQALPAEAAEAIRTICASILLSKSDRPPRVIMVTSATPAEGKTTLVNHMGMAFADGGNKTLLVETDMRKPALSKALGIGSENGLSLFLAGHVSPLPKIHSTAIPNLFAVAAGPKAPNPVALLNSEKLSSFLNEMTASFQFVLLDTPPLLAVADARILCSKVDGVVLVVRAGRTPKNLIRRAWTMLENSGANVLGMVLNGATRNGFETSYYYRHYYE
jgi:succinoglycan biosynthesis transport protein ExoP